VELCPFDFHFTKERIIKTWKAVGFLPMTGNAMKDPKVRYEMGEGGAPDDATNCLDHLRADYRKSAETLPEMGFNGAMFDIEPPVVSRDVIPEGNEAKIQHIIDNRLINKAGGLYKLASSLKMRKWYWKRQSGLQCWMLRQRRMQN